MLRMDRCLLVPVAWAMLMLPAVGQAETLVGADETSGLLVRVEGDVALGSDEQEALVVVVEGDAEIAGTAEVVVVVNGTATLTGARVTELVVVQGRAVLQEGTVVTGNVQLINAEMSRADGVVVQGEIHYGTGFQFGLLVFGLIFGFGVVIVILLSGLIAAAVAPHGIRAAGAALTDEFGKTLLATFIVWIGLPVFAVAISTTLIGIPAGAGIFVFLLPALGFLGYLITGIRVGDYMLGLIRGSDEAWHPYRAALLGLGVLLVAAWIPVVGPVVSPVASLLGSGALVLEAWRAARRPRMTGTVASSA